MLQAVQHIPFLTAPRITYTRADRPQRGAIASVVIVMTLLLLSWLLFAPVFLLLRRALLAADALPEEVKARCARTPHDLAARLHVHMALLDNALDHAERAHAAGRAESTALMLACVRQGAEGLVRDLDADVAAWGKASAGLRDAPEVAPVPVERLNSPWLRALAWSHHAGRVALPGSVARLRLHLFVLRGMLTVFWWEAGRLQVPPSRGIWAELVALRADLPVVVEQARQGHSALVDSTCTVVVEEWRLAT